MERKARVARVETRRQVDGEPADELRNSRNAKSVTRCARSTTATRELREGSAGWLVQQITCLEALPSAQSPAVPLCPVGLFAANGRHTVGTRGHGWKAAGVKRNESCNALHSLADGGDRGTGSGIPPGLRKDRRGEGESGMGAPGQEKRGGEPPGLRTAFEMTGSLLHCLGVHAPPI